MPSLAAPEFATLIRALPEPLHTINVEAEFWRPKFETAGKQALWEAIFQDYAEVGLSRHRLTHHPYGNGIQKCAEILLWGYPSDSRGLVSRLLPRLVELDQLASSDKPWSAYFEAFDEIDGINISTISKLAHFYGRVFDGRAALILDNRLIKSTSRWDETSGLKLAYSNAKRQYPQFLKRMDEIAKNINCLPAQLELFLFAFGGSFSIQE